MIKIEKNEMKQVKSFFKMLKAEFKSLKAYNSKSNGWYKDLYIKLDSYPQYGYIKFRLVKLIPDDENNFMEYNINIYQPTTEAISYTIPIDYIDFLEASAEIVIQDGSINSVKIENHLTPGDYLQLQDGQAVIVVQQRLKIEIDKDVLKDLKEFTAMNKYNPRTIANEAFRFYCFHQNNENQKRKVCYTDGSRLNTKDLNFRLIKNIGMEKEKVYTFLLHQDDFKNLIPYMESILKSEPIIHLWAEYGYNQYQRYNDTFKEYKTDIEITSGPEGYKHHMAFTRLGETRQYPDIEQVIDTQDKEYFVNILLDEKAREETKRLEALKSHIADRLVLEIEPNKLLIKGDLLFKGSPDAGTFEIDLIHLACIECREEKTTIILWKDNFLSMLKEIGKHLAIINSIVPSHPLNYKTDKAEGLCTVMRAV